MATVAAIGAGIAAVGTVVSTVSQVKSAKAQRRLQQAQATRERQVQFASARKQSGAILQAGVTAGAQGSTAVGQGQQGVVQQARSNVSFINQVEQIQNRLASAQALGAIGGGITGVGGAAITASVPLKQLTTKRQQPASAPKPTA
jgi:hypothetical protein